MGIDLVWELPARWLFDEIEKGVNSGNNTRQLHYME
jgi:hypothetical protein